MYRLFPCITIFRGVFIKSAKKMCICDYVKNCIGTCKKCAFGLEKGYKWMNVELPTDLRLRILGN